MTGINHALAGGLIAKYLPWPVALPLALVSHFVLDSLPHYGIPQKQRNKSIFWRVFFSIDFVVTYGLAASQILMHHYLIFFGGLLAVAPDFFWVRRVARSKSFDLSVHGHWFTRWHAKIQRYERPWGIWIEIPLAIVLFYLVFLTPYK